MGINSLSFPPEHQFRQAKLMRTGRTCCFGRREEKAEARAELALGFLDSEDCRLAGNLATLEMTEEI